MAAQPATDRAIGPTVSKLGASGKTPSAGTSPHVGLKPTTPQHAAGSRIEPALSVPSADLAEPGGERGAVAAARAARDPARVERVDDRAEMRVVGRDPVGELVQVRLARRPRSRPPRAGSRELADRSGTWSRKIADPYVVASPAVSIRSLTRERGSPPAASSGTARNARYGSGKRRRR